MNQLRSRVGTKSRRRRREKEKLEAVIAAMRRRNRRNPPQQANAAAAPKPAEAAAPANHARAQGDERDSLTVEKYWGDGWLFHVQTVSEVKVWDEKCKLQRAVVALSRRARTEFQSSI